MKTQNILSWPNPNKSVESNSIPTSMLKRIKNDVTSQLMDTINIWFSKGIFPSVLKIVKVAPV